MCSSDVELLSGRAFVWFTDVTSLRDPRLLAGYELLLSDEERRRHQAFHFDKDRHLYLVAHALLRTSLSRYADVPPRAWTFVNEELGRPELAAQPAHGDRIRFNLSHTDALAACAIARDIDIGIDVECLDRRVDCETIAPRYFSPHEVQQLAELPLGERETRFIEFWTLKEAYVKARGGGLSIPLDSFFFRRGPAGQWRIGFESDAADPDQWQFVCMRPTPNHVMSIAMHRPHERDYEIAIEKVVPLAVTT